MVISAAPLTEKGTVMGAVEEFAFDDLFVAMATFDGLNTFQSLPAVDQRKFIRWVTKARDEASYWARINALALAMRVAPSSPPDKGPALADVLGVSP